jgi:hypothetical protein
MPYIKGQFIGKLKIILKQETLRIKDLHDEMIKQCKIRGIKPTTRSELSKLSFGDKPDRLMATYLKILNALNAIRRREAPYTIEELIEPEEILKPK